MNTRGGIAHWRAWAILGGGLGAAWFASPGSLTVIAVAGAIGAALGRMASPGARRTLGAIFWVGFLVRVAMSIGLDGASWLVAGAKPFGLRQEPVSGTVVAYDRTRAFIGAGDSDFYSERGYAIAEYGRGKRDANAVSSIDPRWNYGWNIYLYLIGLFYFLFGYSPVSVKFINCLFGALLGPAVYCLARKCFDERIARSAGWATSFFLSLMLWSTTNLKDTLRLLLMVSAFLLAIRISQRPSRVQMVRDVVLLGAILLGHLGLSPRSAVYPVLLIGCFAASAFITAPLRFRWKLLVIVAGAAGLSIAHEFVRQALTTAFYAHVGHVQTPGTTYRYLPESFYDSGYLGKWAADGALDGSILAAIGRAIATYLVEPVPWRADTLLSLLAYPQMLVWYACLPMAMIGVMIGFKRAPFGSAVLCTASVLWVVIAALTGGNVGTAFRSRDLILPAVLIFASVGAWRILRGNESVV